MDPGRGWFVTGTDTGVGKSWVSAALLRALAGHGLSTVGMKPVASGAVPDADGRLISEDARLLMANASVTAPYGEVNPYCYAPAIAPHLAAAEAGQLPDPDHLLRTYNALAARADAVVVEGVGGWRVPLAPGLDVAGLADLLGLPVILVVGMRLGCLNHALLTAESITAGGLPLAGWVANVVDPSMERMVDNVRELTMRIPAPLLGLLPHLHGRDPGAAAAALDLEPLLR